MASRWSISGKFTRQGKSFLSATISRIGEYGHLELLVTWDSLPDARGTTATPTEERVPLSHVEVKCREHGILHISAPPRPPRETFSIHLRPEHVTGGHKALCDFEAVLQRAIRDTKLNRTSGLDYEDVPASDTLLKQHHNRPKVTVGMTVE